MSSHQAITDARVAPLREKFGVADFRYGKAKTRVVKVNKYSDRHEMVELDVQLLLKGAALDSSFTHGHNHLIVPTDTCKNSVYVVAAHHKCQSIEDFALHLAKHMLSMYEHITGVDVEIKETLWQRLVVDGKPHHHAFQRNINYTRSCELKVDNKGASVELQTFLNGLTLAKTTKSGFRNFHKCKFTTLPETADRMVRTDVGASLLWSRGVIAQASRFIQDKSYVVLSRSNLTRGPVVHDFDRSVEGVIAVFIREFAGVPTAEGTYTDSVQLTLYEMGSKALEAEAAIDEVRLGLPNLHCILVPHLVDRFGLQNANEVFFPDDEPHGQIEATVVRKGAPRAAFVAKL